MNTHPPRSVLGTLLLAGLSLLPAVPGAAPQALTELVGPDRGLGGFRLGAPIERLLERLGPPLVLASPGAWRTLLWPEQGILTTEHHGHVRRLQAVSLEGVSSATQAWLARLRTRGGIAIGTDRATVAERLGAPSWRDRVTIHLPESTPHQEFAFEFERWSYYGRWLTVGFAGDRVVALGIFSPEAAGIDPKRADLRVVPGKRLDRFALGEPVAEIVTVLGPPDVEASRADGPGVVMHWSRRPRVLTLLVSPAFTVDAAFLRVDRPAPAPATPALGTYATAEGIAPGTPEERILAVLGPPAGRARIEIPVPSPASRVPAAPLVHLDAERWWYPSGLVVELREGRVWGLGVTLPAGRHHAERQR